jgi:prepilin-type N-terminal cleavage/methylation domain-containing protein
MKIIPKKVGRNGFTIVEVTIAIVVAGIVILPLLTFFANVLLKHNNVVSPSVGMYLAKSKMEKVVGMHFDHITDEAQSSFGGVFSDFRSQVWVYNVTREAITVPVGSTLTTHKWIKVRVTNDNQPAMSIELDTLVTDISNE